MRRETSVSGSFYPSRAVELERYFEHFSAVYDEAAVLPDVKSRAVIVPHAGYIYSGYTANIAYRVLQKSGIKTFVVIGPSHRVAYDGISLCDFSSYDTPFAPISAATKLAQSLKEKFSLLCYLQAHAEHSTEVQFPFIKYYMEDASIVELVYSHIEPHALSEIIDFLLSKEDVGVVISTDLSHFYTLQEAKKLDAVCVEAIQNVDAGLLQKGCEACGHIGVEAMLLSAKKLGLRPHILDYRTSADASDDISRVVGYVSACFV
ncbi:MAG: AmmeMemoRadiSam system protein B [Sulfurimonas sp.]|uniref:AmmeMemoRadiSam system protein B n=1 Tax=Sulfurimonas sp. TaxID=2022749 RepID=UPI00262152E4|nr:AmmeMemoRadiSam system protein B [Sulfurimonas sp.]MDD2651499.1 AmmeMemoRadiSam system protein B [Sulfurimonas sp.]MDD3451040.1 AmmeMemoRadiSam system protein B [Sulfurimonas sp.]